LALKAKAVPVLFLTEHHIMKAYWWSRGTDPHIGGGGELSASCPSHFTAMKGAPELV